MFQYFSTNFDGKKGLFDSIFRDLLGNPIGFRKLFLQQQFPTKKSSCKPSKSYPISNRTIIVVSKQISTIEKQVKVKD
jgi:hypothetical protein